MPAALRFLLLIVGAVALVVGGLAWWVLRTPEWERAAPVSGVLPRELVRRSAFPPAGALECKPCHLPEFNEWAASQHAHANRLVNPLQDGPAFNPTRTYHEGLLTTEVSEKWNRLVVRQTGAEGNPSFHRAVAVIGVGPLIQYLTPFPGGRFQVINPAYDPKKGDRFDIYKAEPRGPREWGFWKNGGMNWNSRCAYCHTTGFEKNYTAATDSYASTWKAMGISCEQCHGPLDGHAAKPKVPVRLTPRQDMESCAACHSRREELTGKFHAGEAFDEHFRVALPDLTDLYFPDGQVRDEDFEYGSFLTSKMGHAGISCLDCHNPHSGKLKLPVENNALCLSCHAPPGQRGAIPIPDTTAHSHHKIDSSGNRCVECHMPQTTYMARDPRRDHGFTVPDPQLTKELGIPNSCNRCHADQTTDRAIHWMEEWYKMQRPSRDRARLIARARSGDPTVSQPLMDFFKSEPIPAWRASLVLMLEGREQDPAVQSFLVAAASDASPLVRDAAVRSLAQARPDVLQKALADLSRGVRISASWHLLMNRQRIPDGSKKEIETWLANGSDEAGGAFQQARLAAVEKRLPDVDRWTSLAVARDPSSGMFQQAAQLMYQTDRLPQAKSFFDRSVEADPKNSDATYSLALLEAELGNPTRSLELLRKTVSLAPDFGRAWYNLGLAEAAYGDLPASARSLEKAESLMPRSPDPAFALATVQLRMNESAKAVESARRALALAPGHPGAQGILRQLSSPRR